MNDILKTPEDELAVTKYCLKEIQVWFQKLDDSLRDCLSDRLTKEDKEGIAKLHEHVAERLCLYETLVDKKNFYSEEFSISFQINKLQKIMDDIKNINYGGVVVLLHEQIKQLEELEEKAKIA